MYTQVNYQDRITIEKQQEKKNKISHTSVYKWLETGDGNKFKKFLSHKFNGYKKRKHQTEKIKIKDRVGIEERTENINNRLEKGHFEADLIVSK